MQTPTSGEFVKNAGAISWSEVDTREAALIQRPLLAGSRTFNAIRLAARSVSERAVRIRIGVAAN